MFNLCSRSSQVFEIFYIFEKINSKINLIVPLTLATLALKLQVNANIKTIPIMAHNSKRKLPEYLIPFFLSLNHLGISSWNSILNGVKKIEKTSGFRVLPISVHTITISDEETVSILYETVTIRYRQSVISNKDVRKANQVQWWKQKIKFVYGWMGPG